MWGSKSSLRVAACKSTSGRSSLLLISEGITILFQWYGLYYSHTQQRHAWLWVRHVSHRDKHLLVIPICTHDHVINSTHTPAWYANFNSQPGRQKALWDPVILTDKCKPLRMLRKHRQRGNRMADSTFMLFRKLPKIDLCAPRSPTQALE